MQMPRTQREAMAWSVGSCMPEDMGFTGSSAQAFDAEISGPEAHSREILTLKVQWGTGR